MKALNPEKKPDLRVIEGMNGRNSSRIVIQSELFSPLMQIDEWFPLVLRINFCIA